jgi:hypothetical protein
MNALADAAMSWPTKQPFIMLHAASDCRNCMVAGLNWNLTFTRHLIISSLFAALHGIHTLLRAACGCTAAGGLTAPRRQGCLSAAEPREYQ